jgi:ABC-type molybdate transport system permease subunit
MEAVSILVLLSLAIVLAIPLVREYLDLRRDCGLARLPALATTTLVLPASVAGVALTSPLSSHPAAQWTATVLFALLTYSLAARAIVARASSAATAPSRRI